MGEKGKKMRNINMNVQELLPSQQPAQPSIQPFSHPANKDIRFVRCIHQERVFGEECRWT